MTSTCFAVAPSVADGAGAGVERCVRGATPTVETRTALTRARHCNQTHNQLSLRLQLLESCVVLISVFTFLKAIYYI